MWITSLCNVLEKKICLKETFSFVTSSQACVRQKHKNLKHKILQRNIRTVTGSQACIIMKYKNLKHKILQCNIHKFSQLVRLAS